MLCRHYFGALKDELGCFSGTGLVRKSHYGAVDAGAVIGAAIPEKVVKPLGSKGASLGLLVKISNLHGRHRRSP